ncbi:MAG: hypothetical protein M3N47_13970 [Chloroflexota bacterium]|nr:hypothetical protein [Chloroflexota bacterium]
MLYYDTIPFAGIEEGLAARIGDPLWLLARQWQFAEFTGESAASPVHAEVELEVHVLDQWRPLADPPMPWRPYDPTSEPLERLVEQEPPTLPPRLRVEGGLRLEELLRDAGLEHLFPRFVERCPFPAEVGGPKRLADAIRRRLPDGEEIARVLARLVAPPPDPLDPASGAEETELTLLFQALGLVEPGEIAQIGSVATLWLSWWQAREPAGTSRPAGPPLAWDPHRLEYAFEVRASSLNDTRLVASGYHGGRLDWWAADLRGESERGGDAAQRTTLRCVPAPTRFGGMPVPRLWEMEDASFDLGALDAAASDLGRLLLVGFATVYGNDWFVLPVRVPVASLTRVARFDVTDVFGETTRLGPAGAADDGWNLFSLTDAGRPRRPGGERATSDWFYLPAALPDSLESPPVESVLLLRDEMANLAWAVESMVTDDSGYRVERDGEWAARPPPRPDEPGTYYRLATEVPDHWHPLAPEKLPDRESVVLRLLTLAAQVDGDRRRPRGALLAELGSGGPETAWLHEEEVPRSGAEIVRVHQHARWHDGSVHLWTARRKQVGRGEGSSGLRFDFVEENTAGSGTGGDADR